MFENSTPCAGSVNVWSAILFGTNGACIEISVWTAVQLMLPFAGGVMVLSWLLKQVLFGRRGNVAMQAPRRRRAEFRPKPGQRMARHLRKPAE